MSKEKYEIHWKDFNSPFFRNEIWVGFCHLWPKLFKLPFTAFGICSEKNSITYFADMEAARRSQGALAKQIQNDPNNIFSFPKFGSRVLLMSLMPLLGGHTKKFSVFTAAIIFGFTMVSGIRLRWGRISLKNWAYNL